MSEEPINFNIPKEFNISETNFRLLILFRHQLQTMLGTNITIRQAVEFILEDFLKTYYYNITNTSRV